MSKIQQPTLLQWPRGFLSFKADSNTLLLPKANPRHHLHVSFIRRELPHYIYIIYPNINSPWLHSSILPSSTNGKGSQISGAEFLLCKGTTSGSSDSMSGEGWVNSGASADTGLWLSAVMRWGDTKRPPPELRTADTSAMSASTRFSWLEYGVEVTSL